MGSFLRKPLGLFVVTLVVGLAVIAGGMKALGGTSGGAVPPPTPQLSTAATRADFRHAAMRICLSSRSLEKAIIARGKPRNLREATQDFQWMTPRFDRLTGEVDGLTPPPSAVAAFKRTRSKLDAFDRILDHLDHFAETGQWRSFVLLARSRAYRNLARHFGSARSPRNIHCGQDSLNVT